VRFTFFFSLPSRAHSCGVLFHFILYIYRNLHTPKKSHAWCQNACMQHTHSEFVLGSGNFLIAGLCYTCVFFSAVAGLSKLRRAKFIAISQIAASPQLMRYSFWPQREREARGCAKHQSIYLREGLLTSHAITKNWSVFLEWIWYLIVYKISGARFVYFLSRPIN
jgi:hypothetical protein